MCTHVVMHPPLIIITTELMKFSCVQGMTAKYSMYATGYNYQADYSTTYILLGHYCPDWLPLLYNGSHIS